MGWRSLVVWGLGSATLGCTGKDTADTSSSVASPSAFEALYHELTISEEFGVLGAEVSCQGGTFDFGAWWIDGEPDRVVVSTYDAANFSLGDVWELEYNGIDWAAKVDAGTVGFGCDEDRGTAIVFAAIKGTEISTPKGAFRGAAGGALSVDGDYYQATALDIYGPVDGVDLYVFDVITGETSGPHAMDKASYDWWQIDWSAGDLGGDPKNTFIAYVIHSGGVAVGSYLM